MTPTPEQMVKVARHVGHENARVGTERTFSGNQEMCFIVNPEHYREPWDPINNPADRMDLQDRVRAMGYAMTYCASANDAQQCVIQGEGLGATGWRKVHGYGPDDAHALFWAVWQLIETPR